MWCNLRSNYVYSFLRSTLSVETDLASFPEGDNAVCHSKDGVVLGNFRAFSSFDLCTTLAYDDFTSLYSLAIRSLNSEELWL
jgi:hypothetical protein